MKKPITYFLSTFGSRALCRWGLLVNVICALWVVLPSMVYGESLDDFKTAAGNQGVAAIPFSDLRRDASSISADVNTRKGEVDELTGKYPILLRQKNNLLKGVQKQKDLIEVEMKEIETFKNDVSEIDEVSPYVTELQNSIKEREAKIAEFFSGKIQKINDNLAKSLDAFDRLSQARGGLREYFDKVLSQLSEAKSSPEKYLGSSPSDADKTKLREYIGTIEDHIKSNIQFHKDQEDGAKGRRADFESLLKKTAL